MSEPILTIYRYDAAGSGTPPAISNEASDLYIGYFENRYGEQWIFTFNRVTREAILRGADLDWGNTYPVHDGRVDGLTLGPEESAWLTACWSAARTSSARAPRS